MKILLFTLAIATLVLSIHPAQSSQVDQLLGEKLWTKRDAYDAAHILMVPMHAAYATRNQETIKRYREFVGRYVGDDSREDIGRLTNLQFAYLVSRFIVLDVNANGCGALANEAARFLEKLFTTEVMSPAWQWSMPDFPTMFDRIEWKLEQRETFPSYLKAMIDEEMFAVALASDISVVVSKCGAPVPRDIRRAVALGYRIIIQEGVSKDSGWVFQPGIWRDHPDYAFAGNNELAIGLSRKPVEDIGLDSSHSARFPLWLQSFRCAVEGGARQKITAIIEGLRRQFLGVVLAGTEDGVKLRNFTTGENGVYRYSYKTAGPGGGYGPGGLSFTFNLGWWSFLGPDSGPLYQKQLTALPFSKETTALYLQPIVTTETAPRPRHPQFDPKAYLKGDLIKEVLSSAVQVARSLATCD